MIYWNAQGLGNKRSELIQLINHLKIYIVLLNETHLNHTKTFKIPNFIIYRNDRSSRGKTNCGGTTILTRRNISHQPIQIQTTNIENTIIHIEFNKKELRLGAIYKSPNKNLAHSDLTKLLNTSANTILAGNLNAKNPIWHSNTINTAVRALQNHMEKNNYTTVAPNSPTHYPDIRHHRPDVLDIAIIQANNINYNVENLNQLSSDHNPILLNITAK